LPSTADQLRRHTVLNLPGMLHGLSFEHTVMEPGAAVPISVEDDTGLLIFTIAGRGVMVLDGDRIEVSANDLVHIPAGVPYGMHTLGGTDWVYVVLEGPAVLEGNGLVRRGDHVEPCGDASIRAPLAFARIVRREDKQVTRPLASCPFQAVPQPRRPRVALASQIGAPHRLHEQKVARQ